MAFRTTPLMIPALCLASGLASSGPAVSTADLLQSCQDANEARQAFCQGYILGASDAGEVCIPADIEPATLSNLVSSDLTKAAEDADLVVAQWIQDRMKEVFPCEQEKDPSGSNKKNWSNKERIGK